MIHYTKELAQGYNDFHSRGHKSQKFQNKKIKYYLNLDQYSTLLDAGCGAGRLFRLSEQVNKMIGVEKSEEMYIQASAAPFEVDLYNQDFQSFLAAYDWLENQRPINSVVFSYTLHQFDSNKSKQIQILHDTFRKLGCKNILLITASENQFNESVLNQMSSVIDEIDRNRYLFKHDLISEFNIRAYEEETIYNSITKEEYKKLIESKYISTLQLISDTEFNSIIKKIDAGPDRFILPDYYTYILLEQK